MSDSPFLRKPSPAKRAAAKKTATDVEPKAPAAKKAPAPANAELFAAMLADLQRSGLDAKDARTMRLAPYARGELQSVEPPGAGYVIPYFDVNGTPRDDLYRYRYLEDTRRKGFGAMGTAKARRYTQPAGTPPGVYWPPFADWRNITTTPGVPLIITEGEKKAATATKMGVPCVGLGGVWSFRSKTINVRLLPELGSVSWENRDVYIVYDSDAVRNTQVCQAESALAEELTRQGALVKVVRLPDKDDGDKMGLDDYLVEFGAEALITLCTEAELFSLSRALHKLNTEVIYVQNPGVVMVRGEQQPVRPSDFVNHRFADRQHTRLAVAANGATKMEVRQTAADWIKWPARSAARSIVFAPGEGEITEDGRYNMWKGWAYEPKRGDVKPWAALLDYLCEGSPIARKYIEQWFAYPIQNPGTKLRNAVVCWGFAKGTGKSLLGYTVGDLYGDAFYEIDDSHVEGTATFTEWARHRHFILGDEISGNSARRVANRIKAMITREKVEINIKNIPQYSIRDCINYYFTAQHPDCFYIEEGDRRLFIHEVKQRQALPQEFYRAFDIWRHSEAGRRALMWHLLYGVDTSDFDPMAAPPVTSDKLAMIADTGSELEQWLRDVREYPEAICKKFGNSDLVSVTELIMLFEADGHQKPSSVLLGRKLKVAGVPLLEPKDLKTPQVLVNGKLTRIYALRNEKKWLRAESDAIRDEFMRSRGLDKKPKF